MTTPNDLDANVSAVVVPGTDLVVRGRLRSRLPPRIINARGLLHSLAAYLLFVPLTVGILVVLGTAAKNKLSTEVLVTAAAVTTIGAIVAIVAARLIRARSRFGFWLGMVTGLAAVAAGAWFIYQIASGAAGVDGNGAFLLFMFALGYVLIGSFIVWNLVREVRWAGTLKEQSRRARGEAVVVPIRELSAASTAKAAEDRLAAGPGVDGTASEAPLLVVRNLKKHFPIYGGVMRRQIGTVYAVDGVDFDVQRGEVFSLVGESGCGKTTLGRTILQLLTPTAGTVVFDGYELSDVDPDDMRPLRRRMQIIFQDPFGSLNPRMPISDIIGEGLLAQGVTDREARDRRVEDALEIVGLRREYTRRYPHEFSGGQRQRIGVARALALGPDLVVCDEPVSALDVSIQSQVLNLLLDLRREFNLTYLFISHNLSVVQYISDRVGVMYLGRIVELGVVADVYSNPRHPYTVALLSAIPEPDLRRRRKRLVLKGDVPSPAAPPPGCRFNTRCWLREQLGNPARCTTEEPVLRDVGGGHQTACHFAEEISLETVAQAVEHQSVIDTAVAELA